MKAATVELPAPAQQVPWKIRALSEATRRVSDLQVELEKANRAMRVFRSENMAVLGTQLVFRCAEATGRDKLDREWHQLVTARDGLLREWNIALQEFAEIKTQT